MKITLHLNWDEIKQLTNILPEKVNNWFKELTLSKAQRIGQEAGFLFVTKDPDSEGLEWGLEGSLYTIIQNIERSLRMDLKTVLAMYANAIEVITTGLEMASKVWEDKQK